MSTETVAVEAPVEAPVTQPVATEAPVESIPAQQQTDDTPKTAEEFLKRVKQRRYGADKVGQEVEQPQVATEPAEQPRDEKGRFAPKEQALEEAPAAVVEEAAPTTSEPVADAPEFVEIPLPENHPLRSRGVEHLSFQKDQEEYGRWAVNQATRSAELTALQRQTRELENKLAEQQAAAEFWQENSGALFGPDFQKTYEDLKQTYGDEQAEVFKRGRLAEAQEKMQVKTEERKAEVEQRYLQAEARNFANQAYQFARQRYKGWSDAQIEHTLEVYDGA